MTDSTTNRKRNRLVFAALVALFAAPLLIAWVWWANIDHWRPSHTTNHGNLVTPPRPIHDVAAPLATGMGQLPHDFFRAHWTLVYIGPADCDADCRSALYATRQIRIAVGRDIERVQRLYIVNGTPLHPAQLRSAHPDLTVVDGSTVPGRRLREEFAPASTAPGKIYLVDPLGNLMMTYPSQADPEGMLADLKQLLRLSRIG